MGETGVWPAGGGETGALIRARDWSRTPLGPAGRWPHSLRVAVEIMLASPAPTAVLWGPEHVQIYNDAYAGIARERHPAGFGRPALEVWSEARAFLGPIFRGVLAGGPPVVVQDQALPLRGPGGAVEERVFTATFSAIPGEDGGAGGIFHPLQETTAAVRAQAALRTSEARYRTLFESMDEGFCVIEVLFGPGGRVADYRFLETNPAFVAQTGLPGAVGRTIRELIPTLEEHWFETYGRVARTGEPVRLENRAGALGRWYGISAFRVEEPERHRVAVLFSDVTGQRRDAEERERLLRDAQAARAEAETAREQLRRVFQHAPACIATLRGPDHVFEMANPLYQELVGRRELVGKPAREAVPELIEQGYLEPLDQVFRTGQPFTAVEAQVFFHRGPGTALEEYFFNFVYQPLTDASGAVTGILAYGADVTPQVRARREIEAARAEAEAANRAKSEFLAVMSHELRTPLNAIGGYAELVEMGIRGPVTEQQRHDLHRIRQSQRHLLGLINEVLNYARLESGVVRFDLEDVAVADALSAAAALVAPQAGARGLVLNVAPVPPELAVRADPDKLRQVLLNLLSNAVKFTGGGGRVEMECQAEERHVRLAVRDTGMGIPHDQLERIFEPFVQVRADLTRTAEGTGLGLAISRDLARGMGGDLTAKSTVGRGSTFTLALPRA